MRNKNFGNVKPKQPKKSFDLKYIFAALQNIVKIAVSILCITIGSPLVILFLLNFVIRFLVNSYLIKYYNGKYFLMPPEDAVWAHETKASYSGTVFLCIYEGKYDLSVIRKTFLNKFANGKDKDGISKMKLRIAKKFGYYCWENCSDSFDIKKIVRPIESNAEQKSTFSESEIFEILGKLHDEKLEVGNGQPQWEILTIPKYIYNDNDKYQEGRRFYGVIARIHHSYADGVSCTEQLQYAFGDEPIESPHFVSKKPESPLFKTISEYLNVIFLGPYSLLKQAIRRNQNFLPRRKNFGPKTIGWTKPIRLDAIKKIKSATGTTITTVFNGAVAGCLRQLALRRGEIPRTIIGVQAAAVLPYPRKGPQNRFVPLQYPVDLSPKNVEGRIKAAHKNFEYTVKQSPDFLMGPWNIQITGMLPIFLIKIICDQMDFTAASANVPGMDKKLVLYEGSTQVDIAGWGVLKERCGVGFNAYSYNGFFRVGIVFDGSLISDPQDITFVLDTFQKEIIEMGKLSGVSKSKIRD